MNENCNGILRRFIPKGINLNKISTEKLEKEELIEKIKELEKENKELKEKSYGKTDRKVEEKEISKETKAISTEEKDKIQISEILNDMCHNIFRNNMIVQDIKKCVLEGRIPIL